MSARFRFCWLAYLLLFAASFPWLPELVGDPGKEFPRLAYLLLNLGVGLFSTWVVAAGTIHLLRNGVGRVDVPHADYWFAAPQREASLQKLRPFMEAMALMVMALLGILHASVIWNARQLDAALGSAFSIGCLAAFVLATVWWMVRLRRTFGPPPAAAADERTPRRPRRPGEPHGQSR